VHAPGLRFLVEMNDPLVDDVERNALDHEGGTLCVTRA
jgi:hypothetical protein